MRWAWPCKPGPQQTCVSYPDSAICQSLPAILAFLSQQGLCPTATAAILPAQKAFPASAGRAPALLCASAGKEVFGKRDSALEKEGSSLGAEEKVAWSNAQCHSGSTAWHP